MRHIFKKVLTISLIFSLGLSYGHELHLPNIGNPATSFSVEKEQELGNQIMVELLKQVDLINDTFAAEYLRKLGKRLTSNSPIPHRQFTFFLIEDQAINAFAMPGGYVAVHSKLFLTANTESELAAVLSHEIAHVAQRHIAQAIEQSKKMRWPMLAALLGAMALSSTSPELARGAMMSALAASQQLAINFTRQNEQEADRIGMDILYNAGFDPHSMADFFRRMEKESYNKALMPPKFLLTHPVSESRMADAENRAQQYPVRSYQNGLEFQLARVRLDLFLCKDLKTKQHDFLQQIKKSPQDWEAAYYGTALCYLKLHQPELAKPLIDKLLAHSTYNRFYQAALADYYSASQDNSQALKILKEYVDLFPEDYPMVMKYSQLAFKQAEYAKAERVLNWFMQAKPDYAEPYNLLAKIKLAEQQIWQAHQANASYLALSGNLYAAIIELNTILTKENAQLDFYARSKIKSQLKELRRRYKILQEKVKL